MKDPSPNCRRKYLQTFQQTVDKCHHVNNQSHLTHYLVETKMWNIYVISPLTVYIQTQRVRCPLSDCAHIQHGDNRTTDFEWHLIWPDCVYVVYIYCFICVSFAIASWTVSTRETHKNILKSCVCLRPDIVVNHQLDMSWSAHYDQNTTGYSGKLDINCATYRCNRNENHMVWIIRQTNSHDHEYEQNVVGIHVLWAIQELFKKYGKAGFSS